MSAAKKLPEIEYRVTNLTDLEVTRIQEDKIFASIGGEEYQMTQRFWNSFASRFKINKNVFQYFTPEETFERVASKQKDETIKLCLDTTKKRINAVTGVDSKTVEPEAVNTLIGEYSDSDVTYEEGIVTMKRKMGQPFDIGGDEFDKLFTIDIPIDGYGLPKVYASLERLICENGLIGYAQFLKTDINIGKIPLLMLQRVFQSYNNDGGFSWLMERVKAAQNTPVSLNELQEVLSREWGMGLKPLSEEKYASCEKHQISSIDALSEKKQRLLPTDMQVYELMNIITEHATHREREEKKRKVINGHIIGLLSKEFDLENTSRPKQQYVGRYFA